MFQVTKTLELSTYELVLYQNFCSLLIWPVVAIASGEANTLLDVSRRQGDGNDTVPRLYIYIYII